MRIWIVTATIPDDNEPYMPVAYASLPLALAGFAKAMAEEWESSEPIDDKGEPVPMPADADEAHDFLCEYNGDRWGRYEVMELPVHRAGIMGAYDKIAGALVSRYRSTYWRLRNYLETKRKPA